MILGKMGIKHKDKNIDFNTVLYEFTPAMLETYMNCYTNLLKRESQYTYYAAAIGFNGMPEKEQSYAEAIGIIGRPTPENVEIMSELEKQRVFARQKFRRWDTDGWQGDINTPENNVNIIKHCILMCENFYKYLGEDELLKAIDIISDEDLRQKTLIKKEEDSKVDYYREKNNNTIQEAI